MKSGRFLITGGAPEHIDDHLSTDVDVVIDFGALSSLLMYESSSDGL